MVRAIIFFLILNALETLKLKQILVRFANLFIDSVSYELIVTFPQQSHTLA